MNNDSSGHGSGVEVGAGEILNLDPGFPGQILIDANGTLQIASPLTGQQVVFAPPIGSGGLPHGGVLKGTLSVLAQSDLSNSQFSVGDAIDITDLDALQQHVKTQYDTATGRLQIIVNDQPAQTIAMPAGLTGQSCFSVATDGKGGTTIALVPAPTFIPATTVDAPGAWHEGMTGLGVTVGVISNGFNSNGGLWQSIANNLLPATAGTNYAASWDMKTSSTDEGRAMAEIVHEVAPGAGILFASQSADAVKGAPLLDGAVSQFDSDMTAAIQRLFAQGATVIVDDITNTTEPFYDTDTLLSRTIADLEKKGVVFVTSASNRGDVSFERPIAVEQTTTLSLDETPVYAYRFSAGATEASFLQQVTIANGSDGAKPVTFQWTNTGPTQNNLRLRFFLRSGGSFVDAGISNSGTATNQVYNPQAGTYFVAVVSDTPSPSGTFKFILTDMDDAIAGTVPSGSGSITGHALDPDEITVGAINARNTPIGGGTLQNEPFSSSGPGALAQNGVLIPQGKPDLSAPQRTYTSVLGVATQDNPTGISDLNNFGGTSAAAPVVAATAAMMKQADSSLDASDIRNLMKDSCWAMPDTATAGSGLLRANLAVSYAQTRVISQFSGGSTALYGTQGNDRIVTSLGSTTVDGAGGADTISAGGQSTSVIGGTGTLLIDVSAGNLQLSQGSGSVTVHGGGAGSLVLGGTNGHNLLQGGNGGGAFWGGGSGDTITGGMGDLIGSATQGNATLVGNNGTVLVDNSNDWSFTGQKGTVFTANAGHADVVVGTGDFTAVGRGGTTTVFGGTGNSTVWAQNAGVTDVAGVGHGTLVVGSGHTDLWINAEAGAQNILALAGSGGGSVDVRGFRSGTDTFSTAGYTPSQIHTHVSANATVVTLADNSQITFIGVGSLV
ncbi:S8 family serine peptidase [Acetobacteraceae bacterium KSS8]|uniref:S8 family serine peptidase n=1 Tax=Endosaccharibacter trunci TaxID=2812733 RepID=A0ABT1WB07_9PROT|nr:S8 family serine peptidase [Acetobacteraceae bacterium KSS8]